MVHPPHIYFKPSPTIGQKQGEKQDSMKLEIKTQPEDTNKDLVPLYVPICITISSEELLKFPVLLNNIRKE